MISVLVSLLVVVAFLMAGLFVSLLLEEFLGDGMPTVAAVIADVLCVLVAWAWLASRKVPEAPRPRMGGADWAFLVLCVPCLWLVGDLCSTCVIRFMADRVYNAYTGAVSGSDPGVVALLALVVAPICEETLLRRIAYCSMRRHMSFVGATVISSALFAGMHLTWTHIPLTFMIGLLCCFAMERSGRVWVPVVVHFACNLLSMSVASYLRIPAIMFEPAVASAAYVVCLVGALVGASLLVARDEGLEPPEVSESAEVEVMSDVRSPDGLEVSDV